MRTLSHCLSFNDPRQGHLCHTDLFLGLSRVNLDSQFNSDWELVSFIF